MNIKRHLLKILLLFVLAGSIVNAGYFKDKNKIYFIDTMEDSEKKEVVKNIDFRTFKIFEENDNFAKDKDNVYYKNKKLENVDVNSFQIENPFIVKDIKMMFFILQIMKL